MRLPATEDGLEAAEELESARTPAEPNRGGLSSPRAPETAPMRQTRRPGRPAPRDERPSRGRGVPDPPAPSRSLNESFRSKSSGSAADGGFAGVGHIGVDRNRAQQSHHGRRAAAPGLRCGEWRGPESNRRHHGFQPCALPTELPRPGGAQSSRDLRAARAAASRSTRTSTNSPFIRTASAPASVTAVWSAGSLSPVRAITHMLGWSRRSRATAETPSRRGMCRSMTTASGHSSSASSIAARPSRAVPTTASCGLPLDQRRERIEERLFVVREENPNRACRIGLSHGSAS